MSEEQNTPSGILGEIKAFEEKIEHALGLDAAPSSTEPVAQSAVGEPVGTAANAQQSDSSLPAASDAQASSVAPSGEAGNSMPVGSTQPGNIGLAENASSASLMSTKNMGEMESGDGTITDTTSGSVDLPNAAAPSAAVPSESASASSALSASPDAVTQVVSGSVGLREGIMARVTKIKGILAMHHFEQSVTVGIHDELDAIERLL